MVGVEKKDLCAVLTLTVDAEGPEKTPVEAVAEALGELRGDASTRAVVLRAERPEAWATPVAAPSGDTETVRKRSRELLAAYEQIERFPGAVVAEVSGPAIGWGCEILFAVDLVVAAHEAEFGFNRKLDDEFPAYGLLRGPEVIGTHWTKMLAFSGRRISAEEARRINLVQQLVAERDLGEHAEALAESIALNAPLGVAAGKSLAGRHREDGGRDHAAEALTGALLESKH